MAQAPQQPSPAGEAPTEQPRRSVIRREASFVRVAGDDTVISSNMRDTEISILASSPNPISQANPTDPSGDYLVEFDDDELVELARIKLPAGQAFGLAMQIIERGLADRRVRVDVFRDTIGKLLEQYGADDRKDTASS